MKNILKLLCTSMVMAILISAGGINNIHADQNEEIIGGDNAIVINDTLIETMSTSTPTKVVTLSKGQNMIFEGSSNQSDLYSNNLFTGASTIEYRFENKLNYKLTVTLYKKGVVSSKVSTITIPAKTSGGGIINLTSSSKYYFKFSGGNDHGTNFIGYIIRKS